MGIQYFIALTDEAKEYLAQLIKEHTKQFGVAPRVGRYERIEWHIGGIEEAIASGKPYVSRIRVAEDAGHEVLL